VRQPDEHFTERRRDPRQTKAFAFWIRPAGTQQRISAWMLDISAGGAAFLTAAAETPPVGQRLELVEMQTMDRMVREDAQPLPAYARVLRHDPVEGETRRVAVRFETDQQAPLARCERQTVVVSRSRPRMAPPPPPIAIPPLRMPAVPAIQHFA
jgi:c-di-GMP-binding flagellar brake protein YcgR